MLGHSKASSKAGVALTALNFIVVDTFQLRKGASIEKEMTDYLNDKLKVLVDFANSQSKPPGTHTFSVKFTEEKPSPTTNFDFVIYMIHSQHTSLIQAKDGVRSTVPSGSHWGRTQVSGAKTTDKQFASELRVMEKNGKKLGAIALHELYHAKEQLQDAELHPKLGICSAEVDDNTALTTKNKTEFAAFISKPVKPYVDGASFLKFSKSKYDRDQATDWWDFLS
jgi:hypothetical protein